MVVACDARALSSSSVMAIDVMAIDDRDGQLVHETLAVHAAEESLPLALLVLRERPNRKGYTHSTTEGSRCCGTPAACCVSNDAWLVAVRARASRISHEVDLGIADWASRKPFFVIHIIINSITLC